MPSDIDQEQARLQQELRIHQQIAFASGLFQGDITIRTLLESLAEGVIVIDSSGTILLVNTRAEQMFGYAKKDLIGKPHTVLIPERFRKVHEEHQAHYFAEPRIRPMGELLDLAGLRRDGSEFPVEISLSFIETINGVLVLAFVSDITEHKRAEEALRKSELKLFRIFHAVPVLIGITTLEEGKCIEINERGLQILGYTREEIVGRTLRELEIWENQSVRDQVIQTLEKEGVVRDLEVNLRGRNGKVITGLFSAEPIQIDGERYVLDIVKDITDRKWAEDALRFSEARYRALFRDNPTMIATVDADLTMLSVNPVCAGLLGYTVAELEGQSVLMLFHQDDRPALTDQLQLSLRNPDQVYHWQFRKVRKDGTLLWVEEIAQAVYDLNGALNILVVCQDVTERRKAEEELRKSELKLSRIFHAVPAIIGITTLAEGRCIDINETGLRVLGYRREEMIGRTMLELGVWENQSARDRIMRVLNEEGAVRDLEVNLRRKNGQAFTCLFSAETIDFDGDRYLLSIVKDITDRKRMEDEIGRLNTDLAARAAELEAVNRELEAFNYTVAHDLRKPLTVVNGYCQALRELCGDKLDENCSGYLREAYEGTLRMNRLIEALLNFSQLAHVEPRRETVDLSAMAHEVAAELQLSEPERRVTFRIAESVRVKGDTNLLRAVLDNLFGNAWKYTGTRDEGVIEFGTAEVDGKPACFVRDNGTGFAMEDAGKLFTPFKRLPGAEESRGFGIGLATVERIVARHGGRVWAEGEPGRGATFYFTLDGERTI